MKRHLENMYGQPISAATAAIWQWSERQARDPGDLIISVAALLELEGITGNEVLDRLERWLSSAIDEADGARLLVVREISYNNPLEWLVVLNDAAQYTGSGFLALKILRGVMDGIRKWQLEGLDVERSD